MSYREKQKREIATIKERTIQVKLSDADCDRLAKKCGKQGMTIGELIENFIGDLVGGTYSNGSDEREYADQWFNRCEFGRFSEPTLLSHLLQMEYDIEEFIDLLDNIEDGNLDLEKYKLNPKRYDEEEIKYLKEDLEIWEKEYHDFIDDLVKENPDIDMKKEIEGCRKWLKDYESLKEE